MRCDVVILGGGVVGASAAFMLASEGRDVALIADGRPGGSVAAAGMLAPSFEIGHDAAVPALASDLRESLSLWDSFAHEVADDPGAAFGYRRDGVFGIGYHAAPAGGHHPPEGALPAFSRRPTAFVPTEGSVEPVRFIAALIDRAQGLGAKLIRARGIVTGDGIEVGSDLIEAEHVIIATGADPSGATSGLQAVRGRAFVLSLAGGDQDAVPHVVRSPTVYFCPRADGTLYIGATEEWPGAIASTPEEVLRDAARLLPAVDRAEIIAREDGLRPFIRRTGPLVAHDEREPRIIRAQGHFRNGVLLAPLTAKRISELMSR